MSKRGLHRTVSFLIRGFLASWILTVTPASILAFGPGAPDSPADESLALTADIGALAQEDADVEIGFQTIPEGGLCTPSSSAAYVAHAFTTAIAHRSAPLSLLLVATQAASTSL